MKTWTLCRFFAPLLLTPLSVLISDFSGVHPAIGGVPDHKDAALRSEAAVVFGHGHNFSIAGGVDISNQPIFMPGK
jgi:hypothetical protein